MGRFLKSLTRALEGLWIKVVAGSVTEDENLCRYIFNKSEFSIKNGLKYNVFLPNRGETSVFRTYVPKICNLSDKQVWDIGTDHVAVLRKRTLKARADFGAKCVCEHEQLSVMPETSLHYLHANLISWPYDKHEQMKAALILVDNAELKVLA